MRKIVNLIFKIGFGFIGMSFAIVLATVAFLFTQDGQRYAISKIQPYIEKQIDADILIGSIEFTWLFGFRIHDAIITRRSALLAEFKTLEVNISPLRLLDTELALTIHVHDLPLNLVHISYLKISTQIPLTKSIFPLNGDFACNVKELETIGETNVHGLFSLQPDFSWSLHDVSLKNNLGSLEGSVAMTAEGEVSEAQFQGSIPSLSSTAVSRLKGSLEVMGSLKGSFLELNLHSQQIEMDQLSLDKVSAQCQCSWLDGTVTVDSTWNSSQVHLYDAHVDNATAEIHWSSDQNKTVINALAAHVEYDGVHIGNLKVSTQINPLEALWPIAIEAKHEDNNITLAGQWHGDEGGFRGIWEEGAGRIQNIAFHLVKPVAFSLQPSQFHVEQIQLTVADHPLALSLDFDQESINATLHADVIPASLISLIYPEIQAEGAGSLQASLTGSKQDPKGELTFNLPDFKLIGETFEAFPVVQSTLHVELDKRGVRIEGALSGLGAKPIAIQGILPVTQETAFRLDYKAPIHLTLDAEGEIEPLIHFFFTDTETISGQATLQLTCEGTLDAPQVKGVGHLKDGAYESFSTGAVFKNIQANFEVGESTVNLVRLTAVDGGNGMVEGSGYLTIDPLYKLPFEFNFSIQNMLLVNLDIAKIITSGQVSLGGDQHASELSGQLTFDKAKIAISEELPTQIKTIDVTYINRPENQKPLPPIGKTWPMNLNLNLAIPSSLTVKGKGLSSLWKGQMILTGTPSAPLLNGELKNVKGEYDFGGRLFTLEQGTIQFAGAPDKKTALYVVASKDIDRMTAEIVLKGSINKPVVTFHSNPPMAQKEILSYILFGRGITDISPTQGAQLNQSILTLSSSGKKDKDLLSKIRSTIGIDRVDISRSGPGDSNAISLQVGKYISKGILVSVNKSITAESNSIGIEAALTPHIKVKGEVSDEAQDCLTIEWKRDY